MWNLILASVLSFAAVDVKVAPLAGEAQSGTIVQLNGEHVVVRTPEGERTFDLKNVVSVVRTPSGQNPNSTADIQVVLQDGSVLLAETYTVRQGKATIRLVGGLEVETRTRSIRSVRLKQPMESLEETWREILESKAAGDLIVIRKTGKGAGEDAKPMLVLDRMEGIVQDISADTVKFEFEGEAIDVRREKLEGIIYYSPVARELPSPLCRLIEVNGSRWVVKSLRLEGDNLLLETAAGVTASLPVSTLQKLDFSVGNTTFLSDLEPDSVDWSPFFDSATTRSRLAKIYQPRRDTAFDGGRLLLGGQSFDKGLAIHSKTKLVYRLPKDGKKFLATIGIDDRVSEEGNVRLTISGDDRVLFDRPVLGKDAPLELNLDVTGVRRLTILVDFGDEIDIGDHLNLCNARITK